MLMGTYYEAAGSGACFSHALLMENMHSEVLKKNVLLAGIFEGFGNEGYGTYASSLVSAGVRNWFFEWYFPEVTKHVISEKVIMESLENRLLHCRNELMEYGREKQCVLGSSAYIALGYEGTISVFYVGPGKAFVIGDGVHIIREQSSKTGGLPETQTDTECGLLGTYPYYGMGYRQIPWEGKVLFLGSSGITNTIDLKHLCDALDKCQIHSGFQLEKRLARIGKMAAEKSSNPDLCALAVIFPENTTGSSKTAFWKNLKFLKGEACHV